MSKLDYPNPKGNTFYGGTLTIRHAQHHQPWTLPYSPGVIYASEEDVPHILGSHNLLHAAGSLGRIAKVFEALDHSGASKPTAEQVHEVRAMSADLVTNALRWANLLGFDLAESLIERVYEKNGQEIKGYHPDELNDATPFYSTEGDMSVPPLPDNASAIEHTTRIGELSETVRVERSVPVRHEEPACCLGTADQPPCDGACRPVYGMVKATLEMLRGAPLSANTIEAISEAVLNLETKYVIAMVDVNAMERVRNGDAPFGPVEATADNREPSAFKDAGDTPESLVREVLAMGKLPFAGTYGPTEVLAESRWYARAEAALKRQLTLGYGGAVRGEHVTVEASADNPAKHREASADNPAKHREASGGLSAKHQPNNPGLSGKLPADNPWKHRDASGEASDKPITATERVRRIGIFDEPSLHSGVRQPPR